MQLTESNVYAQKVKEEDKQELPKALQRRMRNATVQDSVFVQDSILIDSATITRTQYIQIEADTLQTDSTALENLKNMEALEAPVDTSLLLSNSLSDKEIKLYSKEKKVWIPNPARATWLAVVFPGGGQIYNRKYWKLPIIYGGFVGCAYALNWNNQMYSDYSQAYLDIMDDNPNTNSFLDLLPPGYDVDGNMEYLKKVIKRKKDSFRRYRDLSIFCFIGVYIVSIIDAYVDAELASFDISKDLSLKMEPTIINNEQNRRNSYGLQCSLRF